ncbi:MAG: peptide deformylase [Geminicoccaceae bacterium]|nr:MAG: peptide deformylase [Geminicoccaceae bacterium]
MTLLKIARLGHPVLLARARPVGDPTAPEIRKLAADMIETMRDAGGIGLAAPQVHESVRLVVALPIGNREESRTVEPLVLVDPELEPLAGGTEEAFEGCLSIPGLRGLVPRARRVGFRALDLAGRILEGEAEGLFARILQHELDHLDGVLFPMRMTNLRSLAFESELRHLLGDGEARPTAPSGAGVER